MEYIHYWPALIVILFAVVAICFGIKEHFEDRTIRVPPEPERLVPRFDPEIRHHTIEAIHEAYAEMKETDPKRAGREMYEHMLKLHGK